MLWDKLHDPFLVEYKSFQGVLTLAYYPNPACLYDWKQEKTADDLLGHQRTSQLQLNLILSACSCIECRVCEEESVKQQPVT